MTGAAGLRSAALEMLLHELIDYAGLFPPATLPMDRAVRSYAGFRTGPHAWMLGRFVVPLARIDEFEREATPVVRAGAPWHLSVLGTAGDRELVERFNARHYARLVIDAVEGKAAMPEEVAAFAALAGMMTPLGEPVRTYVEVPVREDPGVFTAAIAGVGARAKVRTGGTTPDAFPTSRQLARFLGACAEHDVTFKATAGLHHPLSGSYPLTYEPRSALGTMFGFLNVFLGGCFMRAGFSEERVTLLLEERHPRAFAFDAGGVTWQGHRLDAHSIDQLRGQFAASFGSCSFAEPVDELTTLGLL